MARKPKSTRPVDDEDDDLGAGILDDGDDEKEDEDELVKLVEPKPPAKSHGIVVEDVDIPAITGAQPSTPILKDSDYVQPVLSPSAKAQLDAEMACGKETLAKTQAELKANTKAAAKAEVKEEKAE